MMAGRGSGAPGYAHRGAFFSRESGHGSVKLASGERFARRSMPGLSMHVNREQREA